MTDDTASDCAAQDCARPAPPGRRCPGCRGEPVAAELGIENTTDELLAVAGIGTPDPDAGTVQRTPGGYVNGE